MTMNSDSVIEGFNVFKYKPISMAVVPDTKPVKPFSFNQRMERFNASVIIWIAAMRIASLH